MTVTPITPQEPAKPPAPPRSVLAYIRQALAVAVVIVGALQTSGVIAGSGGQYLIVIGGVLLSVEHYIDGITV